MRALAILLLTAPLALAETEERDPPTSAEITAAQGFLFSAATRGMEFAPHIDHAEFEARIRPLNDHIIIWSNCTEAGSCEEIAPEITCTTLIYFESRVAVIFRERGWEEALTSRPVQDTSLWAGCVEKARPHERRLLQEMARP